jgi:hypothetical protein
MFHMVNNESRTVHKCLWKKWLCLLCYPKMENGMVVLKKLHSQLKITQNINWSLSIPVLIHELVKGVMEVLSLVVYLRVKWVNVIVKLIFLYRGG